MVATEVRTVGKRAVCILLKCFLLANICAVGETDNQIIAFFQLKVTNGSVGWNRIEKKTHLNQHENCISRRHSSAPTVSVDSR